MERSRGDGSDELQRRTPQNTQEEVKAREAQAADCCVICLEVIREACELLPCGHQNFDYLCIINWLHGTPVCPLCKGAVSKVLHGPPESRQTTLFGPKPQRPKPPPSTRAFSSSIDGHHVRPLYRRSHRSRPRPPPTRNGFPASHGLDVVGGRRHQVYLYKRFSKHVGSNRLSLYRELTPVMFCANSDLVSRARMWIRRELQVFSFLAADETDTMGRSPDDADARTALAKRRADNVEFLLEYIIAILKSVDMMGSTGQAEEMLSDFLGRDNTKLFLHELRAWLRSPYTKLEDWDRAVQYDPIEPKDTNSGSGTRQNRNTNRYASDRQSGRHNSGGDSYRPDSTERHSGKGASLRCEPCRNYRRQNEAEVQELRGGLEV